MRLCQDTDMDDVVNSVREEADAALANLRRNHTGKSTGVAENI